MRTFLLALLILTFGACTMQKRHYRKGWSINWGTERKSDQDNNQEDLSKKKDSLTYDKSEKLIGSSDENLSIILNKSISEIDTIRIEEKSEFRSNSKLTVEPKSGKADAKKTKLPIKISTPKDENRKSNGVAFFLLAFITFIGGLVITQFLTPEILSTIGILNSSNAERILLAAFIVLLILFLFFLIYGLIQRRNFKDTSNPNSLKAQRIIRRKEKRDTAAELRAVGIKNRTKLWLLLAGIIVVIAIAALFLIEYGGVLSIMAILPFFAFICVAILEFIRYKKNASAYERGEYDPEKFLNLEQRENKKKKSK